VGCYQRYPTGTHHGSKKAGEKQWKREQVKLSFTQTLSIYTGPDDEGN
jgi:hypothetical protein